MPEKGQLRSKSRSCGDSCVALSSASVRRHLYYRTGVELADSVHGSPTPRKCARPWRICYGSLAGAELAQRDYLLTAQQVRLDEYARRVKVVQDRLAELGRLTRDNPTQHAIGPR